MVVTSFIEMISIGAVLPFLGVLTAPQEVFEHQYAQFFIDLFLIKSASELILPISAIFTFAIICAGSMRILLLYAMTRLTFSIGTDISVSIYKKTLYQEYAVHVSRNSSEIINSIITKVNIVINQVIGPILTIISAVILIISIFAVLVMVNIQVALVSTIFFGILYGIILKYTHAKIRKNSQHISMASTKTVKCLQEGLGAIRDILIDNNQKFYYKEFHDADFLLRKSSGGNVFMAGSPRYIVETLGMILIVGFAYIASSGEKGIIEYIPILGVFALGAQKLLPMLQQAYNSYSNIKGAYFSLESVLLMLNQPISEHSKDTINNLPFKHKIQLKNVSFRYSESTPWILKNVDLTIDKGKKVGFIGVTGGGKSTLLDIIMGLLNPTKGELIVDGVRINVKNVRSWQKNISHVPQSVYLSDGTVSENIAFGIPEEDIDYKKVEYVAKQAQINETIESWADQYKTVVGERGVKLSGGQRQRLGIARALYKTANILILDESTSALDVVTENSLMSVVNSLGKDVTVLIITHRVSTLDDCDKIIELSNHKLKDKHENINH
jgi:ATP-binding cassette subfamily B protein